MRNKDRGLEALYESSLGDIRRKVRREAEDKLNDRIPDARKKVDLGFNDYDSKSAQASAHISDEEIGGGISDGSDMIETHRKDIWSYLVDMWGDDLVYVDWDGAEDDMHEEELIIPISISNEGRTKERVPYSVLGI